MKVFPMICYYYNTNFHINQIKVKLYFAKQQNKRSIERWNNLSFFYTIK